MCVRRDETSAYLDSRPASDRGPPSDDSMDDDSIFLINMMSEMSNNEVTFK